MDAAVTVSIVTYNSPYIFKTLDSFKKNILNDLPVTILIHDNGSDKAYLDKLHSYESDQIHIYASGHNAGFGHGHNANLALTHDPYFLICNPDIIVNRTAFLKIWQFLQKNSRTQKIAMVAPKIVGPKGEVQHLIRRRLDVFDYILRFIPFKFVNRIFHKRLSRYECRDLKDVRQSVNYVSGAFMFASTEALKRIKGFDEQFFMYFEDNDICDRLRQKGYQLWYIPDAQVIHFYGKASHRSWWGFRVFLKSMRQYFNKWGWQFF